jgi:hypothetical protein
MAAFDYFWKLVMEMVPLSTTDPVRHWKLADTISEKYSMPMNPSAGDILRENSE